MSKKRKKFRVAFRKNVQRKPRANDLTRELLDQGLESDQLLAGERLSGKGDVTRHRTIIAETHGDQIIRDVDVSACLRGRVLSATGLTSVVQAADGRRFECTVRKVLRKLARDERNAVVAGDRVLFLPTGETEGVIERVEPRHGTLTRGSQRHAHVLVANVDQVVIVASAVDPPLKPGLIDRFLISAEKGDVRAIVAVNKCDLIDTARIQPIIGLYARLGYDVVLTSAETGTGIPRLREMLANRETVFTGQSGVGKSSLLNAVQPGLTLATGGISGWTHKGKHTTRRTELLQLEFGGWVVDTPGIRQLELWDVLREEVEAYFIEFRPFVTLCKFADCSHLHEAGCGVKRAVDRDLISPHRYDSYVRIITGDEVRPKFVE